MKVKDKVKVEENFENFEDDILEKKAEVQVKAKMKVKDKVKVKVKVKENFENFEDDILEKKVEVKVKVKAKMKAKVKVKGFGFCLVSLDRNASAPERRFVVPKSSCIL